MPSETWRPQKSIERVLQDNTVGVLTQVLPESVSCGVTVAHFGALGSSWNDFFWINSLECFRHPRYEKNNTLRFLTPPCSSVEWTDDHP